MPSSIVHPRKIIYQICQLSQPAPASESYIKRANLAPRLQGVIHGVTLSGLVVLLRLIDVRSEACRNLVLRRGRTK